MRPIRVSFLGGATGRWEVAWSTAILGPPLAPCSRLDRLEGAFLEGQGAWVLHGRELGAEFDFLTWFEFAPGDAPAFDALLAERRATEEWRHVVREVELRLRR